MKTILNLTLLIIGEIDMPTVQGKKYPYTKSGIAAANKARKQAGNPGGAAGNRTAPRPGLRPRTGPATGKPMGRPMGKPMGSPTAPATKGNLMKKGYNFTKNIGADDTPDIGY